VQKFESRKKFRSAEEKKRKKKNGNGADRICMNEIEDVE